MFDITLIKNCIVTEPYIAGDDLTKDNSISVFLEKLFDGGRETRSRKPFMAMNSLLAISDRELC